MQMGDVSKKRASLDEVAPSAICSCTQCESIFCFGKRHLTKTTCSCEHCKSKTCTGNKLKDFPSDEIIAVYLNAAKSNRANLSKKAEELTEDDINYELERNTIITTNLPPPKSLHEYIDRLYVKTPSERFVNKPESLSEYIDLITGKTTSALESYIKDLKEKSSLGRLKSKKLRKCKCCKSIYSLKSEMEYPKQSGVQTVKRKECETEVRSVMLSGPSVDFNPLTKQIKSQENTIDSGSIFTANNSIFKYDIFAKIKEAYNACSCIVCECIPTMQSQKDVCSCKPCECADCKSFMKSDKIQIKYGMKYTPSQYISRCLTQKPQLDCACKPCDCALCKKADAGKPCDCDQCQCDECKPNKQTGAPHGDRKENTSCQCAPCECTECVHGYINVSKNSLAKASLDKKICGTCQCEICPKDVCAVGVESCNCEKVLNKNNILQPENKELLDFDIQTALILNDIYHHKDNTKRSHDMVAMYSALPRIHNYASNNMNTNQCNCDVCECLSCVCKEDTINAIKSSQLFSCHEMHSMHSQKNASLIRNSATKNCDCAPCECQICNDRKHQIESFHLTSNKSYKSTKVLCSCKCAACFCSDTVPESIRSHARRCKCTTCRCERCFGEECASANHILNRMPFKKGEVLSPVAHQEKIQKLMLTKSNFPGTNAKNKQMVLNKNFNASIKSVQEVTGYNRKPNIIHSTNFVKAKPSVTYRTVAKVGRNTVEIGTGFLQSLNKNDMFKYNAYAQSRDWSKGHSVNEINLTEKISESYVSVYPSTESASKTSIYKENDTTTSILVDKDKSLESCNSSGYDHPRYLIRFPKSPAETCLEDVMKDHLGNGIKLNDFNTRIKRHKDWAPKNKDKSSNYNIIKPVTSFSTTTDTKESGNSTRYENINNKGTIFYYEPKINRFSQKATKHLNIKYDIEDCNTALNSHKITHHTYESNQSNKNIIKSSPNLNCDNKRSNRIQGPTTGKVFACFNLPNENISEFGKNKDSKTDLNVSSHKLFDCNIDSLNINVEEDYKRVKETIKDANEFSRKLLRLLETYEKANREFKRISDMLHISNAALVKTKDITKQQLFDVESEKIADHMLKATRDEGITTPWSITTETHLFPNDIKTDKGNNLNVFSHKFSFSDTPVKMNAIDRNDTKVRCTADVTKENQASTIIDERPCKDNANKETENTHKRRDLNLVMEILDPILGNPKNTNVTTPVYQSNNASVIELQLQTEELSVVTIPPSHVFVTDDECQYYQSETTEFSLKAELEFQTPQKVDKLVGEPILMKDKGVSCSDVESMEDLEDTVKELLTEFVLQPLEKEEKLVPEKIQDQSSYFRSDSLSSLKVNFLLVRKVSDHTVLVKWSQPWDLTGVQGYELLVDGRAVQKIFNPSKCIAVVTCLPHTDKILLTIRTITTFVPRTGHLPATTIIYRPRARRQ